MNLSEICIRRPVFTWVLVGIPVVMGAVSYFELSVDLFPKVDFPVVSVTANLPGTSPQEMETSITRHIEEAVNTVSGVDELQSTVREGVTTVVARFVLEKDGDVAAQEVRDKLSSIMKLLPDGIETPLVDKFDLDASPIMSVGVSGRRDVREVTEIAKHEIQEVLPQVPGVGRVFLSGGRTRAINIILDTHQLTSFGLSVEDVRKAILTQHLEVPGGIVQQGPRELVLRTLGKINTAEQFDELIITTRDGYPIRIKDVGRAVDGIEEPRGLTRLDGQNAVSLFIQKQSGSNTVKVADGVLKLLAEVKKRLPADIEIQVVNDQSRFIRRSMEEVKFHLLLAAVLVSLTILLFIRDWRTTLIATVAIPTSIVPTFFFMSYMGFSLNNITMLALILAIGIVIDDAVVVHENIFRHMEEHGLDAMAAARKGTKEIALAVLATSVSLVVIFLPVAFMGGMVGRFFSSFGLTVAFAIVMSLFVSFTLTPMLCSRFLKLEPAGAGHSGSKSGFVWRGIDWLYGKCLRFSLRYRFVIVLACIGVVYSTGPIARRMGIDLVPRDDQSEFQVTIITPEGYTLDRVDRTFAEIEERLMLLPGIVHRFTVIGENNNSAGKGQGDVTRGSIHLSMKELEERAYSQFDVMQRARKILQDYPDLRSAVTDVSTIQASGQDSRIFQLVLSGPDLDKLSEYSGELVTRLRRVPGLVDVDTTLSLRKPEVQVSIDRDRASDLGIPVETIANTLNVLVGGQPISRFTEGTEQYDIWLRRQAVSRQSANARHVERLFAQGRTGRTEQPGQGARIARAEPDHALQPPARRDHPGQSRRHFAQRRQSGRPENHGRHEPAAAIHGRLPRSVQDIGRNGLLLHGGPRPEHPVHVPDPGRTVRKLVEPVGHPGRVAGDHSLRLAVAVAVWPADGSLCHVRAVHAGGHRQEERHPAGRQNQRTAPRRHGAQRGHPRSQSHAAASHPHDHHDAHRGHGAHCIGRWPWRRRPRQHGQGDHRRPDVQPAIGPASHARDIFPARLLHQPVPPQAHRAEPRGAGRPQRSPRDGRARRHGQLVEPRRAGC